MMSIITIPGRFDLVNSKFEFIDRDQLTKNIDESKKQQLTTYHILDISGNFINRIDLDSITYYFPHISELYLINNELKDIPAEINRLIHLKKLYLSKNKLTSITNIDQLVNLELLDLRANRITNCNGMSTNIKLNYLSLSNNLITDLTTMPSLEGLESLFLFSNKLDNLEETFSILKQRTPALKKLLLECNPATPLNRSPQQNQLYRQLAKEKLAQLVTLDWKPAAVKQ
ncbi:hypothetical protein SAMD00019534_088680, partial [Acytostelium subglobosum LB1]|uniref:hypothetical protein n=1 Tax=Acytostelium subglobosum LB1 TaxID=1410327 RepID=UPI0006449491